MGLEDAKSHTEGNKKESFWEGSATSSVRFPASADAYTFIECVGKGTEGFVWRAVCLPLKRVVAIKIVNLEMLPNAGLQEIRQQMYVMQLCNRHPNIIDNHVSFIHSHYLWFVTNYLGGGSCSDIMKYGFPYGLDETAIRHILKSVLKALVFFHANGRIHRDIKAGNILISDEGHVQVADFGVSAYAADSNPRTTLCGTPCWMAPEIMKLSLPQDGSGEEGYDQSVDIWSLGITAVELAKGRPPFFECPPSRVFSMVMQSPPPTLESVEVLSPSSRKKFSNSFQDLIGSCLQKDPSKRPSAEKLLKHKFFRARSKREYLVDNILSKLPPLGQRYRMQETPGAPSAPCVPVCDVLHCWKWVFPGEEEKDADNEGGRKWMYSTPTGLGSFAPQSFLSTASSMDSDDEWMDDEVPMDKHSVEFLNYIFHVADISN